MFSIWDTQNQPQSDLWCQQLSGIKSMRVNSFLNANHYQEILLVCSKKIKLGLFKDTRTCMFLHFHDSYYQY